MQAALREGLEQAIAAAVGGSVAIRAAHTVSGGCIHRSFRLDTDRGLYFLKLNDAALADALSAEIDGLQALQRAGMRVPTPIAHGTLANDAYLVMEHLSLGAWRPETQRCLGEALARLHHDTQPRYGWHRANYIGATPQRNDWHDDWSRFWSTQRLQPQLQLAARNGYEFGNLSVALSETIRAVLADRPSALLHGDLWNGNAGALADGAPVLFDPAVYCGDPETDLAMTELFGGFGAAFYDGYRAVRDIEPGYETRKHVYNLYHVLNHLNLFGAGYSRQAESLMRRLIAETK